VLTGARALNCLPILDTSRSEVLLPFRAVRARLAWSQEPPLIVATKQEQKAGPVN
jgi:hypothetical protein